MKIGILDAIPPDLSAVNWQDTPVEAYIRFLDQTGAPFSYRGYAITSGELPGTADECDAYVITGSPRGAYDGDPWIDALTRFIRLAYAAEKKLVGICFGHQILAQALGGRVAQSAKGYRLGLDTFTVAEVRPWMADPQPECALYFAHGDQVLVLPPGAALLGGDEFCPIGLYAIENQVLGIQGHPEFTRPIMDSVVAVAGPPLGAARHAAARQSLESGQPDAALFARWIVNFLTS